MNGQDRNCTQEDCKYNTGGLCMGRLPVIGAFASNAVNMGMTTGFATTGFAMPFMPLFANRSEDLSLSDDGDRWRNCHIYREQDLRK